jgi:hypothetical protein
MNFYVNLKLFKLKLYTPTRFLVKLDSGLSAVNDKMNLSQHVSLSLNLSPDHEIMKSYKSQLLSVIVYLVLTIGQILTNVLVYR